jgi:peptidoglycan/LPS O-acetylase OafA/YrhL
LSSVPQIYALTSVRGAAAWWVVFYHFRELFPAGTPEVFHHIAAQGYLAVDLFFILSGFVITLNYRKKFESWSWKTNLHFYGARLGRIYPLHLVMMVLFLANPLAIHLFSSEGSLEGRYEFSYYFLSLLLIQNWGFTSGLAWNIPAWSISTEWFAYLVFPFSVAVLLRGMHGVAALRSVLVLLLVVLGLISHLTGGLGSEIERFGLWRCVIEFQIGVVLCLLRERLRGSGTNGSDLAVGLAVALFAAYALLPIADYLLIPTALTLFIYGLTDPNNFAARHLHIPALIWIGEISYSTYLVHFFVKDWVKFVLVRPGVPDLLPFLVYIGAVLIASAILYRWIEVPGQRFVRSWLDRKK